MVGVQEDLRNSLAANSPVTVFMPLDHDGEAAEIGDDAFEDSQEDVDHYSDATNLAKDVEESHKSRQITFHGPLDCWYMSEGFKVVLSLLRIRGTGQIWVMLLAHGGCN